MLDSFSPIFVADTKIIFVYTFVAPLIQRVLDENTDSFVNFINSFLKVDVLHKGLNSLLVYIYV